ncbi:MAG TPA: hypothetical protein VER96_36275 [Polyangiaceae bacterium]|nr:hypothetical protein [Polyangiaceae bacterium]
MRSLIGRAFILSTVVGSVSCYPFGNIPHCDSDTTSVTADDPKFASGPAAAVAAATMSASGTVSYSNRSSSLPTSSTLSLDIAWDQSTVEGSHLTCDDGSEKWGSYFTVPVTAQLSTSDGLFSATLTGKVKNAADGSRDLELYFDPMALSDLHGSFSWRDVNGWSSESDVCADVRILFSELRLKADTVTLVQQGQLPGFINVDCPSETPPVLVFSVGGVLRKTQ